MSKFYLSEQTVFQKLEQKYEWNFKNYQRQKDKEAKEIPKEAPIKAEIIKDKEIYLLEESNFYDFLNEQKLPVIVLFSSNSCYECEKLHDYLKLFSKMNLKRLRVATINSEIFPSIAIKYHIVQYPTLKLFSDKYEGKELTTNSTMLKEEVFKFIPKNIKEEL